MQAVREQKALAVSPVGTFSDEVDPDVLFISEAPTDQPLYKLGGQSHAVVTEGTSHHRRIQCGHMSDVVVAEKNKIGIVREIAG